MVLSYYFCLLQNFSYTLFDTIQPAIAPRALSIISSHSKSPLQSTNWHTSMNAENMNPKAKALHHFIFLSNANGNNMPAGNRRNILRTTSSNNSLLPVAISYHDQNGINSYVCIPFEVLVKKVEANTTTRKKNESSPAIN